MWEYIVFQLWDFVGGPFWTDRDPRSAEPMNDTAGTAGLLNARGAQGWELVTVVPQSDASARYGTCYVAYMKRPLA
jgi:hypothetical protein